MRAWPWIALLLALPGALAQAGEEPQPEACRPPILEIQEPPSDFDPGSSVALLVAIENANGRAVDNVRALVTTTAPAGWTAIPGQRELSFGPGEPKIVTLAVTAPNRGSGVIGGNVTILVAFVCTKDDAQHSASTSAVLPVKLRAFEAPWPLVLGGFAVLAGGVTVLGLRRLRRGIALAPTHADRDVTAGKSVKFTFTLENRRGKPQRLRVVPSETPPGFALHLALKEVDLEPGEEKTLWAILKAPITAAPGLEVAVTLRFEEERGGKEAATAQLRARVLPP